MQEAISFYAGAGRSEIQYPAEIFPFREGHDMWTGVHDTPCVRAVILDAGIKTAIVSLEICILEPDFDERLRQAVSGITGIEKEHIWLSATHTVTSPHMRVHDRKFPGENPVSIQMRECVFRACQDAVQKAHESLRPAVLGSGRGTCSANINRIIPTRDGWWLGSGEEFACDHSVPVIKIADDSGAPIALLYSYHCELAVMDNSVMSDGGRHITADLAGAASRFVEQEYDGQTVALFLPGITSDQGPNFRAVRTVRGRGGSYRTVDIKEKAWLLLELEGERLGEQVLVAAEAAGCHPVEKPISIQYKVFRFPGQKMRGMPKPTDGPVKEWPFLPDEERTRSVEIMLLDQIALVSIGGLGIRTAQAIQERSPFAQTIITGGVSGSAGHRPTDGAKNMAEADLYEAAAFQARNSTFGKGAAEKMREDAVGFLNELYAANAPSSIR